MTDYIESIITNEKETVYKIVRVSVTLIYRWGGGASSPQCALRLPHSGTAGGIALKSSPDYEVPVKNQPGGKYWTIPQIASAMRHVLLKILSIEIYRKMRQLS